MDQIEYKKYILVFVDFYILVEWDAVVECRHCCNETLTLYVVNVCTVL